MATRRGLGHSASLLFDNMEKTMSSIVYARCEAAWPEKLPPLTGPEAVTAVKRLYRFAMKRKWAGKVELTSGRRYTWPRRGVFYVNPNRSNAYSKAGWHDIVHFVSHYCHARLYPNARPHDHTHATLERTMIEYVIKSGWLDGKLKRPEKKEATPLKQERYQRILRRQEAWEAKERRARNALKKLKRQRAYYERTLHAA